MPEQCFNPAEKFQSQVPALQMLVGLGFQPLSQGEAVLLRGGGRRNVLLTDVLAEQLLKLNSYKFRGKDYAFDLADAHEAIRRLEPTPDRITGLQSTNQQVYDALLLGTTISKTIDGDTKSYSFRYVDWSEPSNNVFHVTAEYSVERTGTTDTKRCDVVGFVNGIPFVIIENKRPTESVKKAGSQLIGYQDADNIPHLFHFSQLLLSMNRREARYATVGTPRKFWHTWRDEEDAEADVEAAANRSLNDSDKAALFTGDLAKALDYFDALAAAGPRAVSDQDRLIYALCRPERLLDMVRRFTVFDGGTRKIARHQQYFGVRRIVDRVATPGPDGNRRGGVVWHTQGSGKSLTMLMLGKALALDKRILNPRILIVTDRDDLDKQIAGTFRACDLTPVRAVSGSHLESLLVNRTPLVTTIINKFEGVARRGQLRDADPALFVLVDESHRSQSGRYGGHGQFARSMRQTLPRACYLGFTGTPLLGREKNTVDAFGGVIHSYTIDEAITDGAVLPLLYEGRIVDQQLPDTAIDRWFEKISDGLTPEQKMDLKRKFSRGDALARASQVVRAKAFDISEHFRRHWQGTGFKAQLVAPSKAAAIQFKEVLDEIGHVASEVIISAPNDNEGHEEVDGDSHDLVLRFWDDQMRKYGGEAQYNRQIVGAFQGPDGPEILIVVSKLLTGFDAPRNTVLYICKSLKEHTLLQAVARVNRLFEDGGTEKEFGFIVDYEGLLGELDRSLTAYSALSGYDSDDLKGAVYDIREQIRLLPHRWEETWDVFKALPNKLDMESLEQYLAEEDIRFDFYARLSTFAKCLHIALSSDKLADVIDQKDVDQYVSDWKRFSELRRAVRLRYQETVDLRDYEPRIQKLLDDHVAAMPAEVVIELININDPDSLRKVVEETEVSPASKADRIASATKKTIVERMDEDPALYSQFSRMLQDTIDGYRARRLAEKDYLLRVLDLAGQVRDRRRVSEIPVSIKGDDNAAAVYGAIGGLLTRSGNGQASIDDDERAEVARDFTDIIREHLIVGIWSNATARNTLLNALDDYCWDELEAKRKIDLHAQLIDELQSRLLSIARARFPR